MKTAMLGEVAELRAGVGFPLELQGRSSGDFPLAKVGDISRIGRSASDTLTTSDHFVSTADLEVLRMRPVPPGSVLFAKIGEAIRHNHRVVAGCQLLIDNNAMAAIPRTDLIDPRYLFRFLQSVDFYALASSTTVPAVRKSDLARIRLPVPGLVEQRRIAAILEHADSLRAKRREVLAHLADLTQAIFHDMFGHLAWRSTLGDLADVQIGPFGSLLHQEDYIQDGVAVLNPTHISGGELRPDPVFSVTQRKAESLSLYRVREGDVLMGRRGEMGRAGVAYAHHSGMLCGTGSLVLRPKGTRSVYLHAVVTSPRMKTHLERNALGATLPNLNAGIVKTAPAPGAALEAQEDFVARVEKTRQLHRVAERAAMADDGLFSSLQSRGFRGEL